MTTPDPKPQVRPMSPNRVAWRAARGRMPGMGPRRPFPPKPAQPVQRDPDAAWVGVGK
jgi:hypothetical protein